MPTMKLDNNEETALVEVSTENSIESISVLKDQVKKMKRRVVDTARLFGMLKNAKTKVEQQNSTIVSLEKELNEKNVSIQSKHEQNRKILEEFEQYKNNSPSQKDFKEYEKKVSTFEIEITKLNQELSSQKMYAQQLEASNTELKTQWDQRKSEFNSNKASEKHRQELNKKNQEIKALETKLTALQEEVDKLDEENMELRINKEFDEVVDEDSHKDTRITELENELTEINKIKDNRIKELEQQLQLAEQAKAEYDTKHKALEHRIASLQTTELVNSQLVEDNKKLQTDISSIKSKYDLLCAERDTTMKVKNPINKQIPQTVHNKLAKLKAENLQLKLHHKFYQKAIKKQFVNNFTKQSIEELVNSDSDSSSDEDDNLHIHNNSSKKTAESDLSITIPKRNQSSLSNSAHTQSPISPYNLTSPYSTSSIYSPIAYPHNVEELSSITTTPKPLAITSKPRASIDVPAPTPKPSTELESRAKTTITPKAAIKNNVGYNGLMIPKPAVPSTVLKANTKTTKPKNKGSSKLEKFVNSKNPSKYMTTSVARIPFSSTAKVQSNNTTPPVTIATQPVANATSPATAPISPVATSPVATSPVATSPVATSPVATSPVAIATSPATTATSPTIIASSPVIANSTLPSTSASSPSASASSPSASASSPSASASSPSASASSPSASAFSPSASAFSPSTSNTSSIRLTSPIDVSVAKQAQARKRPSIDSNKNPSSTQQLPSAQNKKRKIEYPISTMIEQFIKSRTIAEIEKTDERDIEKCIAEISECYRRMKSIACPEISETSEFGAQGIFTISAPTKWDKREKSYAWYLSLLCRETKFSERIVIGVREQFRKGLKEKNENLSARWMRLFCLILKSKNDMNQMLANLRELSCRTGCRAHLFISVYNTIVCWKECFSYPHHHPVHARALQTCVASIAKYSKTPTNAMMLYSQIAPLVHWPTTENSSGLTALADENLLKILQLPAIKKTLTEEQFRGERAALVRSIEMVLTTYNNWKAIFNSIILKTVWPLVHHPELGEVAVELLGTLGKLGMPEDILLPNKEGVDSILNALHDCMTLEPTTESQRSFVRFAAEASLKLGSLNPICRKILNNNS